MGRLIRRTWRYLVAALTGKLNDLADPKVQVEQAIADAEQQHQALTQQAAAVIGNQRQLEMKLARQLDEVERLQSSARQALVLEQQARAGGDTAKADGLEQSARAFATQLVAAESSMQDLKQLHDQALSAAETARTAVEQNAMALQQKLAERTRLLNQIDAAKMQEQISRTLASLSPNAPSGDTPNLAEVRDKIEQRYARALGASELASHSVEAQMLEVQKATLDAAGEARLEKIRASLGGSEPPPAVESS